MATLHLLRQRPAAIAGSLTLVGLSAWAAKSFLIRDMHAESLTQPPKKIFGGFPGPKLRLESSTQVNHNTKRLRFAFPNESDVSGLALTSAVLVVAWPKGHWFPTLRPYTPISSIDTPGSLELMVKQYPNGKASTYLHSLPPGSTLFFLTSLPGYKYIPNAHSHVTLIAGGAGITPLFQLTRSILGNPSDRTKITLVWGINSEEDELLKEEFAELESRFPGRLERVVTVSKTKEGKRKGKREGYVTRELLEEVLGRAEGDGKNKEGSMVFVSGPPGLEKALVGRGGVLEELGFGKDKVFKF